MNKRNSIKVVLGMSGGVDSSVAAAKLVREGFDVVGMHLKLWSEKGENRCCSISDERDARAVAAKLGIPFYVYDLSKEFKKIVVDYFLSEYARGRTPNPCTLCNREIRFGLMLKKAKELGADFLATGHYARIARSGQLAVNSEQKENCTLERSNACTLLRGIDVSKDQSYMLALVRPEDLAYAMFPLGEMTKDEVRELAKKWGIKTAAKRDSQEVCFVANNYRDFLARHIAKDIKPGSIVDRKGRVFGKHLGLPLYTIGQRKGIEVCAKYQATSTKEETKPMYVVGMDLKKNQLVVGEEKDLESKEMMVEKVNWISSPLSLREVPTNGRGRRSNLINSSINIRSPRLFGARDDISVQIRYHHEPTRCKFVMVEPLQNKVKIRFDKSQKAITPGQTAVFYRGNQVLGGGIIKDYFLK